MSNALINKAKVEKNDEFYTQYEDIEKELEHYKIHFENKVVYCNCDNPEWSNFYKYFKNNFKELKLSKLISTHYQIEGTNVLDKAYKTIYNGLEETKIPLIDNGDFRNKECIEILKESDIVVTNPPFSLFRDFVTLMIEYNKKFLIIGHQNNYSYKGVFNLIKNNKIWLGYGFKGLVGFFINRHYEDYAKAKDKKDGMIRVSGVHWFTNLEHNKKIEFLKLEKNYNENDYPKYDNYDCINVNKTKDIPLDYNGYMGVPISFINKYNKEQFEICGLDNHLVEYPNIAKNNKINGKNIYKRVIIRHKI